MQKLRIVKNILASSLLFGLGLFLNGCHSNSSLTVKEFTIKPSELASTKIRSPDPRKKVDWKGSELLVRWNLTAQQYSKDNTYLNLTLHYQNHTEEVVKIPLKQRRGSLTYQLIGDKFKETKGLSTYRVEVYSQGEVMAIYEHFLWAELIS
ncbi:MAG: hypothetical protein K0S74_1222 [Chlamydiales bacterium]|jgi:hypothetical protein|nr:hypothetical protein [Chlamydiales bacterium]